MSILDVMSNLSLAFAAENLRTYFNRHKLSAFLVDGVIVAK